MFNLSLQIPRLDQRLFWGVLGVVLPILWPMSRLTWAAPVCQGSDTLDAVGELLAKQLDHPDLKRTRWGIDIRQVAATGSSLRPIYARNAQQLFLPASTAKLFTTAALVENFNPTHRIETPYFAKGQPPVLSELRIQGAGDPTMLDPQLQQMAKQLKTQGVRAIRVVIGDGNAFGAPTLVPSWEWQDLQSSDGVPITSLSFSQNSLPIKLSPGELGQPLTAEWLDGAPEPPPKVLNRSISVAEEEPEFISLERSLAGDTLTIRGQLRVGAEPDVSYVAIADPEAYFLHRLRQALESEGIQVGRLQVEAADTPDHPLIRETKPESRPGDLFGAIASPPLEELLQEINQSSNNFYTESLLRHLAWYQGKEPRPPVTTHQSLQWLQAQLEQLGVDPQGYALKDASGLSRQNLVSPESLTTTLASVLSWRDAKNQTASQQKFETFQDSLAIAGQSGTLKNRFGETSVAGNLFAKTGTLSGTVALAGFLEAPGKPTIILTLLANHSDQSIPTLRETIDGIVVMLHQAQICTQ